jgi:hypothetical protein
MSSLESEYWSISTNISLTEPAIEIKNEYEGVCRNDETESESINPLNHKNDQS